MAASFSMKPLGRCNILMIQNRDFTRVPLRLGTWHDCNTHIQWVRNTAAALLLLSSAVLKPPNLVILSWQFPDGATPATSILRALKSHGDLQSVPVIALVRDANGQDIRDMYSEQCACVIELPENEEDTEHILSITRELWLKSVLLPYSNQLTR